MKKTSTNGVYMHKQKLYRNITNHNTRNSMIFFLNISTKKTNKRQQIVTFTFKLNRNSQNIERGATNSEKIIVEHRHR